MQVVAGDQQSGAAGRELPQAIVARVVDASGHPVKGQVVNFRVTAGGGTVFAGSGSSNDSGIVQERWTLGKVAGDSQALEARAVDNNTGSPLVFGTFKASAIPGAVFVVTVSKTSGGPFDALGETHQLAAAARDTFGNNVAGPATWSSSNTTVATVTQGGLLTTIGNGSSTISATIGGKQGLVTYTIAQAVTGIRIVPDSVTLAPTATHQFSLTAVDRIGTPVAGTIAGEWTRDSGIPFTVSASGLVTAPQTFLGSGEIRARYPREPFDLYDYAIVNVVVNELIVKDAHSFPVALTDSGKAYVLSQRTQPWTGAENLTFSSLAAGWNFRCGLVSQQAYCGGSNSYGQLGRGSFDSSGVALVSGGHLFGSLTAGFAHACGVTIAGVGYCWGYGVQGALGDGGPYGSGSP